MIVYMMRHGETEWNVKDLCQGITDVPMTEKGRKAARLTKEGLKDVHFDVAFCSPLSRAKETAEIILEGRDIELIVDQRIIEMNLGEYEGTDMYNNTENLDFFFTAPEKHVNEKGMETFESVLSRAKNFLEDLFSKPEYQDSTILVSAHGCMLCGLVGAFKGIEVKDFWKDGLHKNCGMTIIEVNGNDRKILKESIILYDENELK